MEYVKKYTKYILFSFVIALVLLCLTGVIFAYTNIDDKLLNTFVFVIIGISNLIGSTLLSRRFKKRGFLNGLLFGIIYFLIIYLISVIFYTGFFVNKAVGIYVLVCSLAGIIGGIIGVNIG